MSREYTEFWPEYLLIHFFIIVHFLMNQNIFDAFKAHVMFMLHIHFLQIPTPGLLMLLFLFFLASSFISQKEVCQGLKALHGLLIHKNKVINYWGPPFPQYYVKFELTKFEKFLQGFKTLHAAQSNKTIKIPTPKDKSGYPPFPELCMFGGGQIGERSEVFLAF